MTEYIVEPNPYPTFKEDGFSVRCDDWLIQREEIVRCRDCAKADYAEVHMFDGTRQRKWTCTRFKCFHHMVEPDDFCSRGARREP